MAELGSVSAAARALGFSQSAVSRQIGSLERETGYPLIVRSVHGVQLTREGTILLRGAIDILDRLDLSAMEVAGVSPGRTLRVGFFPVAGAILLPQVLAALRQSRPEVKIVSRQGSTPGLVRALRTGALDFAVISQRMPYRAPDSEFPPLVIDDLIDTELRIGGAENSFDGSRLIPRSSLVLPGSRRCLPTTSRKSVSGRAFPGAPR